MLNLKHELLTLHLKHAWRVIVIQNQHYGLLDKPSGDSNVKIVKIFMVKRAAQPRTL